MKRRLISILLLVLGTLMGHAQCWLINGDLNHDGKITVEDMALMANIIVEKSEMETIESESDLSYGVQPELAESAELVDGPNFNDAMHELVHPGYEHKDYYHVKKFIFRKGIINEGKDISSSTSQAPIKAIYNEKKKEVHIYVAANKLILPASCKQMFKYFANAEQIDWRIFGEDLDTSNVADMSEMFSNCEKLTMLDVSPFNTSNVTNMSSMFDGCSAVTALDVSHFDTSKVTDMSRMFNGCITLAALDVEHFETSLVTNMSSMFNNCGSLESLDVTNFDTQNVTDMSAMFHSCGPSTLDITKLNTSKVTNMNWMFGGCGATTLDFSNFDTGMVTDMSSMFEGCVFTAIDLSDFDTHSVTDMSNMFRGCRVLTSLDLKNFYTHNVSKMASMFIDCHKLESLDISRMFTIADKDMIDLIFYNTAKDVDTLTITCSSATQVIIQSAYISLDSEKTLGKINWNIID